MTRTDIGIWHAAELKARKDPQFPPQRLKLIKAVYCQYLRQQLIIRQQHVNNECDRGTVICGFNATPRRPLLTTSVVATAVGRVLVVNYVLHLLSSLQLVLHNCSRGG